MNLSNSNNFYFFLLKNIGLEICKYKNDNDFSK